MYKKLKGKSWSRNWNMLMISENLQKSELFATEKNLLTFQYPG